MRGGAMALTLLFGKRTKNDLPPYLRTGYITNITKENTMKVSDLVKLKSDPHEVLGIITEVAPDCLTKRTIYFIKWICDMCDDMWVEAWDVEAICK